MIRLTLEEDESDSIRRVRKHSQGYCNRKDENMNIGCVNGNREEMNLRDILKIKSTRLRGCFVLVNKEGRSIKDNTMISIYVSG